LIIESQYIVSGKVISITELEPEPNDHNPQSMAKIAIIEVLQGEISTQFINVQYDNLKGFTCPAPAHYEVNTTVLAFLDFSENKYITHALSYGSKKLEPDEIEIYKTRIIEMQNILQLDDSLKKYTETVDWLIMCAEHPTTQWEGVCELSPHNNFMSFFSEYQPSYEQLLSNEQKNRVLRILQKKECFDHRDFGIIDLVYSGNEIFFDHNLVKSLSNLDGIQLVFASEYMKRLKHLIPSSSFDKFYEKAKYFSKDYNAKKQKANILKFIAAINN